MNYLVKLNVCVAAGFMAFSSQGMASSVEGAVITKSPEACTSVLASLVEADFAEIRVTKGCDSYLDGQGRFFISLEDNGSVVQTLNSRGSIDGSACRALTEAFLGTAFNTQGASSLAGQCVLGDSSQRSQVVAQFDHLERTQIAMPTSDSAQCEAARKGLIDSGLSFQMRVGTCRGYYGSAGEVGYVMDLFSTDPTTKQAFNGNYPIPHAECRQTVAALAVAGWINITHWRMAIHGSCIPGTGGDTLAIFAEPFQD